MNHELPSESDPKPRSLDELFADKPHTRERLVGIGELIDRLIAEGCTADEAESRAIEQVRKLGQGLLVDWGEKAEQSSVQKARSQDPALRPYRKKSPVVAFDLRRDPSSRAAVASRTARPSSAPFL
jgi:hypothetical protein